MNLLKRTFRSLTTKERRTFFGLSTIATLAILWIFFSGLGFSNTNTQVYAEGVVGSIEHLNPLFTEYNEVDADISSLIFSGLVHYDPETETFNGDLATHTLSPDQRVYTFTLKNDLFWHDGEELTTDDVYFTFHDIIQSTDFKNPILKSNFDGVKIEKVDTHTITFTLNTPNSFFYSGLTVGILPQHLLKDVPVTQLELDPFNQAPIGSGPYKVTSAYSTDNASGSMSVELERFEDYYGTAPKIKALRFIAYPTWAELKKQRSEWHGVARIKTFQAESLDNKEDLIAHRYELPQYTALFFNTDSELLNKNKVRLGLSKAIDKKKVLEVAQAQVVIDTPVLELNQSDWILKTNLTEAAGALYDAGWSLPEGEKFRKNSDGKILKIDLLRRDFSKENPDQEIVMKSVTTELIKQWEALGVQVVALSLPSDQLQEKISKRDYDMLLYGQSLGYNLDVFSYWHSSQVGQEGLNLSNYQNPKADVLMEKIRQTFDPEARSARLNELAQLISQDVPAIFLYTPSYYYMVDARVTGIDFKKLLLPKDRFANIDQWKF